MKATGSTNADVLEWGRNGEASGAVLVADVQTAGRGRHGRNWVAPAGSGLLCSVLLRPPGRVADLVTATVAVAALDAVQALGVNGVAIKWPNDLVVSTPPEGADGSVETKLAGILAEADWTVGTSSASGRRAAMPDERVLVVAGLGMNVAMVSDLPDDVAIRRVCIEELLGESVAIDDVLDAYLNALDRRYGELVDDPGCVLDAWREGCMTIGRRVRVDLGIEDLVGVAVAADEKGRLVVRGDDGHDTTVSAGDVVHLRSAL